MVRSKLCSLRIPPPGPDLPAAEAAVAARVEANGNAAPPPPTPRPPLPPRISMVIANGNLTGYSSNSSSRDDGSISLNGNADHLRIQAAEALSNERSEARRKSDLEAHLLRPTRLQLLVSNPIFEGIFSAIIMLNAVFIGVETDIAAVAPERATDSIRYFKITNYWNWLDTLVVLTSLVEFVVQMLPGSNGGNGAGAKQFRILRMLRVTRLIKIVRATSMIRFIRALRTLIHQIMSTFKSLVWVVVLLVLLMFLFGILFTQTVTAYRDDKGETSEGLQRYWSTLPRSMLTLFMAMSGGVSWELCILPLSDLGALWVALFIVYVFFVQMAVLNTITGVFCHTAIDSAAHDHELVTQTVLAEKGRYTANLRNIFRRMDDDESGGITILEFQASFQKAAHSATTKL
mmetsp:Transcript_123645/g.395563  ORF Transcript_123645/g.395563 Transcript_123645/m.395563 type:complete len:403 (+) Transcript_123645:74-1282(+)